MGERDAHGDLKLVPPPCDRDPYSCTCEAHTAERVAAIERQRKARIRQPWEAAA